MKSKSHININRGRREEYIVTSEMRKRKMENTDARADETRHGEISRNLMAINTYQCQAKLRQICLSSVTRLPSKAASIRQGERCFLIHLRQGEPYGDSANKMAWNSPIMESIGNSVVAREAYNVHVNTKGTQSAETTNKGALCVTPPARRNFPEFLSGKIYLLLKEEKRGAGSFGKFRRKFAKARRHAIKRPSSCT